ncbi:MAG: hypothetical protein C4518_08665, partial [Desulfobacteraceae bacterium]
MPEIFSFSGIIVPKGMSNRRDRGFLQEPFVHFLCSPKENEPKERAPVSLGLLRRLPCAPRTCRNFRM